MMTQEMGVLGFSTLRSLSLGTYEFPLNVACTQLEANLSQLLIQQNTAYQSAKLALEDEDALARWSSFKLTRSSTLHRLTHSFCALRTASYRSRWGSVNLPDTGNVRVMSEAYIDFSHPASIRTS